MVAYPHSPSVQAVPNGVFDMRGTLSIVDLPPMFTMWYGYPTICSHIVLLFMNVGLPRLTTSLTLILGGRFQGGV
jgi:hypothetical protein